MISPTESAPAIHVIFVCWGNICRSPMAERIAEKAAREAGLTEVRFTSAGTSSEESGNPIDSRAAQVLEQGGYRASGHRAHKVTPDEVRAADLVVAMEPLHLDQLRRLAPEATNLALMTDFDATAVPGSGIDDPWYGTRAGFETTLLELELAIPGVIDWIRSRQGL